MWCIWGRGAGGLGVRAPGTSVHCVLRQSVRLLCGSGTLRVCGGVGFKMPEVIKKCARLGRRALCGPVVRSPVV